MIRRIVMSREGEFMRSALITVAVAATVLAAPPAAGARTLAVSGTYVQLAPCVPTGGAQTGRDRFSLAIRCATGLSTFGGDLFGNAHLQDTDGRYDSRRSRGTLRSRDTFYGYGPAGRRGTLLMRTRATITRTRIVRVSRIVGGTDGFKGASGELRFEGQLVGSGRYAGTIEIPRKHWVGWEPN